MDFFNQREGEGISIERETARRLIDSGNDHSDNRTGLLFHCTENLRGIITAL